MRRGVKGVSFGQQGSSNCRFKGDLGDVGCRVEIDDLTPEDQCVVKIAISGLSACTHSKVEELDACSTCMPQRKRALRDWCVKHKHKAKTIVQVKVNKRAAEEQSRDSRCASKRRVLSASWEAIPQDGRSATICIARQWASCSLHSRFRTHTCGACKRLRDTAQAKWEETNPSRVAKVARR